MFKEFLQILKDAAPNSNQFWWLIYLPTILILLMGLCWIIFLFPEWKKDIMMVFFLFLAVLLVSVGLHSIIAGISLARKVDWQIESGIVLSSHVQENEDWRATNDSRSLSGTVTEIFYIPYITCKYSVEGKEYSEEMVAGRGINSSGEAQSFLNNQFPIGKKIDFYYDPKHPENAVIEIPSVFSRMLALLIGLILTPGGLFIGWVLMISLYNNGKTLGISEIFRVPVRLEYQVSKAAIKIFKLPETEKQKLESYMEYLNSINDYIEKRGSYSSFYTQDRVISEQIKTMERLVYITKNNPDNLIRYCTDLFDLLERKDRLVEARAIIDKIRTTYPTQFNASYLKNKLVSDSTGRK